MNNVDFNPYDIFYKEFENKDFGPSKHYYVCIYSQKIDENNRLVSDIYGLMITSNPKYNNIPNDYNVKIEINGKVVFVLCDKLFRFKVEEKMTLIDRKLNNFEKSEIKEKLKKFLTEIERQVKL